MPYLGVKLPFSLVKYASKHNMGIGNVRLKDGSSLKFLTKVNNGPDDFVTKALRVKNGRLLDSERIVGTEEIACAANKYEKLAENSSDVFDAWSRSLDVIV